MDREAVSRLRSKIQAVEAVSEGPRIYLEQVMSRRFERKIRQLQNLTISILRDSSAEFEIQKLGRLAAAASMPLRAKRKLVNMATAPMFQVIQDSVLDSDIRRELEWHLDTSVFTMSEYGVVVGLNLLGYSASSRRVTDLEARAGRVSIRKAASVRVELSDAAFIESLQNRVIRVGGRTTAAAVQHVRDLIRDMVVLGGGSVQDVQNHLENVDGFARSLAERLSRTEMHQAYSWAQYRTYQRSGIEYNYWLTVGDNRVRPQHVSNESVGSIPMGDYFPSGQRHPGEGGLSVNCRCALMPDLGKVTALLDPWTGASGPYQSRDGGPAHESGRPRATLPSIVLPSPRSVIASPTVRQVVEDEATALILPVDDEIPIVRPVRRPTNESTRLD